MNANAILITLLSVSASSLFTAGSRAADVVKNDIDTLQGTWEVTSAEKAGEDITKECQEKHLAIEFQGDAWLQKLSDGHDFYTPANSRIILDTTKTPRQFNHVVIRTAPNGQTVKIIYPGIYELDRESLKLCYDVNGKVRPKDFTTKGKDGQFFATLRRKKEQDKR